MEKNLKLMYKPVLHVGVEGLSGQGKTIFLTKMLLEYWMKGFSLYTNFWVLMDHKMIFNLDMFYNLIDEPGDKVAVFDDFESDMSSKFLVNKQKSDIVPAMINFRKDRTRLLFSTKRFEEIDKSAREICDWLITIDLQFNPYYIDKLDDIDLDAVPLKYCRIYYVERQWFEGPIMYEGYLYDLDLYSDLFDTSQKVASLHDGVGGTPRA